MGYSISLSIRTGLNYHTVYDDNYTYNVSPMFVKSLGEWGLRQLHGVNALDAIDLLNLGIERMESNPDEYKELNPPNG